MLIYIICWPYIIICFSLLLQILIVWLNHDTKETIYICNFKFVLVVFESIFKFSNQTSFDILMNLHVLVGRQKRGRDVCRGRDSPSTVSKSRWGDSVLAFYGENLLEWKNCENALHPTPNLKSSNLRSLTCFWNFFPSITIFQVENLMQFQCPYKPQFRCSISRFNTIWRLLWRRCIVFLVKAWTKRKNNTNLLP